MSFCQSCGSELKPGDRFCNNCGAPVQQPQYQQPVQQPQYQQSVQQPQYQQPVQQPQYQQPMQQPQYQQLVQQPQYQQPVQQPQYQQPVQQPQYQQPMQQPQYQQSMQQPQYQQPVQQPAQQWNPPTYPEGTPVITIVYPGGSGNINEALANKMNYVNIQVNGVDVVPPNTIKKGQQFSIDVPITSNNIHIEIWVTSKLSKTKPQRASFFNVLNVFDLFVDPSRSYIFEITDPSVLVGNSKYGYLLGDEDGNFIEGKGQNTSIWKQIVSLFLPPVGLFFLLSPEAKEDEVTRNSYIIPMITGLVIWIITLIEILSD